MTKVTVFGEQESKAEKKPIEFVFYCASRVNEIQKAGSSPSDFEEVCLLGKANYGFHWIMAWNHGCDDKYIYLGHWNDGVV